MEARDLATPELIAQINGRRMRFFRGTADQPEMAWFVFSDLLDVVRFPAAVREEYTRQVQAFYGEHLVKVETREGPVLLAPHPFSMEIFESAIGNGLVPEKIRSDYIGASTDYMMAQCEGLSATEMRAFLTEAHANTWAKLDDQARLQ